MRYYIWKLYRSIRSWWMITIKHESPEVPALYDFFDNPKQPWNK